jgi:CDP-glucose 4,6-dehydratase
VSRRVNSGAFNFGPDPGSRLRVRDVATIASELWGGGCEWTVEVSDKPYESKSIILDSTKAKSTLGWREKLSQEEAITWAVDWSKRVAAGESARDLTMMQLSKFMERQPQKS